MRTVLLAAAIGMIAGPVLACEGGCPSWPGGARFQGYQQQAYGGGQEAYGFNDRLRGCLIPVTREGDPAQSGSDSNQH